MSVEIGDHQLAIILRASLDHAKELLERAGGFLPFGTRALPSGELEFLQAEGDHLPLETLYRGIAEMLADEARRGAILATGLVAHAQSPGEDFQTAVSVLVEAPEVCRVIVAPYRVAGTAVEFGIFLPEPAEPLVFRS